MMEMVPNAVSLTGPSVVSSHHPGEPLGVGEFPGRAGMSRGDSIKWGQCLGRGVRARLRQTGGHGTRLGGAHGVAQGERPDPQRGCAAARDARNGIELQAPVHRNEIGTRPGGVWRLHGPRRRPGALLVRGADASVRGKQVTTIESFEGPSGLLHPVRQGPIARWVRTVALARPPNTRTVAIRG